MKKYLWIVGLFVVTVTQAQQLKVIDRIVAHVGDEIVLLSEVEEQYALMSERQALVDESYKCGILENLLIQKLLVNQAELDSLLVTDEEIELQLEARIDRVLQMMNNDVEQFEAYYNKTVSEVKEQFRQDLKNQILAERMQASATADIIVTPQEVTDFFESIPKDSLPYFGAEVEVSEIVVKPKVNDVERQKAIERLENLKKRIMDGESFDELARKFSDDPGSGAAGGDLGWMKRGSLVPEFEEVAYGLEKGQLSDVVESEFGMHLIELLGRRGNSIHTRHILIKPVITENDRALARNKLDSIRDLIYRDTMDFTQSVNLFSDKKSMSYNNGGRLTNTTTGNTFFEIADLDTDIYFAIDTLKVNEISETLEYRDERGETAYRIVKLVSMTEPHRANLKQDYFKIQRAAVEQKKNVIFTEWLKKKAGKTYISLTGDLESCPNMALWKS